MQVDAAQHWLWPSFGSQQPGTQRYLPWSDLSQRRMRMTATFGALYSQLASASLVLHALEEWAS